MATEENRKYSDNPIGNQKVTEEYTEVEPLRQEDEEKEPEVKRDFTITCGYIFRNITVEPCILLFNMSYMVSMLTTQNLSLEKACRVNLNYSDEICQSLKMQDTENQNEYEREAQKLLASAMASRTYITATVPCIIALFVGSWSDRTGHRKMFIIISVTGQILVCINNMMNVYFFKQLRLEVLVFSEAVLEGFTGGWSVCFLSAFSYISAITTDETRTFRMGLLNFSLTVGFPIGMGISGPLLKNYGYYVCYGLSACLHTLNVFYNIFYLKDPKRNEEQKKYDGQGIRHFFCTFFDLANVKETVSVVVRKTPDNRRIRLGVLIGVVIMMFGSLYGELAILYMSTRYRFGWDEVKFSIFQTYNFVTHTAGTIFSILVFSKYLNWHDSVLGMISTFSKFAASFAYCFASNERIFYIAPLLEILNGTSFVAVRSIFSKLVEPNEIGKVNSIVGLTENLMPLIFVPVYTKLYTATMEVLPGAVFLLATAMSIISFCVFIWLYYEHNKELRKSRIKGTIE